jgi:hypothetical protein
VIGLIPWPYRIGIAAALVGILCVSSYVAGRKSLRGQMDALRQGYEIAAAQAAGREAERVRQWTNAVKVASEKYDERAKIADSSFDASLDRLRNAYSSVKGVRFAAPVAGECPGPSGPTRAELLGMGETLARLVREADRDRAALASCVAAWPR